MNKKSITAIEKYWSTENYHYNYFAQKLFQKAEKKNLFDDLIIPLELWSNGINICMEFDEKPLVGLNEILKAYKANKLDNSQIIFCFQQLLDWFKNTLYDDEGFGFGMKNFIESKMAQINPIKNDSPSIKGVLRNIMRDEIENLPAVISNLSDTERVKFLTKMVPYFIDKDSNDSNWISF